MAVTTVAQLATELGRPAAVLLDQLSSAGVTKRSPDDALSDADSPMPLRYGETPDAPLMVLWILDRLVAPIGFVRRLDN